MALLKHVLPILFSINLINVQSAPRLGDTKREVTSDILFNDELPPVRNPVNNRNIIVTTERQGILDQLEDKNQNWGILINGSSLTQDYDDENKYQQPIYLPEMSSDFSAITKSDQASPLRQPNLQADSVIKSKSDKVLPTRCEIAQVTCCFKKSHIKTCFETHGCMRSFPKFEVNACTSDKLQEALEKINTYYRQT